MVTEPSDRVETASASVTRPAGGQVPPEAEFLGGMWSRPGPETDPDRPACDSALSSPDGAALGQTHGLPEPQFPYLGHVGRAGGGGAGAGLAWPGLENQDQGQSFALGAVKSLMSLDQPSRPATSMTQPRG